MEEKMEKKKAIVILNFIKQEKQLDIEIPLDITVYELVKALYQTFHIPFQFETVNECYIRTENPIGFFRGNLLLSQCSIMDGTMINI